MIRHPQTFCRTISHKGKSYRIGLIGDSDIPAIRVLVNIAYKELADMGLNYTATYQDEKITKERISNGSAFAIFSEKDEVVATVLFTKKNYFTNSNSGYVSQLAVHPSLKRSGFGTILMNLCEEIAQHEAYEAVQLDTAKPAHHLVSWYKKNGYQIVGETKWEDKTYESWIFEKRIVTSKIANSLEPKISKMAANQFSEAQEFYTSVGYLQSIQQTDIVVSATLGNQVIGIVRLAFEEGFTILRGMMIAPHCQRRGIGTLMLNELRKHITNDCLCLPHGWLEEFYGQIGFQKIEPEEAPEHLQKRLIENQKKYPRLIVMKRAGLR